MIEWLKDGKLVLSNTPALHEEIEQLRSWVVNATENIVALKNKVQIVIAEGQIINAYIYWEAIYENIKLWKRKEMEALGLDWDMADMFDWLWTDLTQEWDEFVNLELSQLLDGELYVKWDLEQVTQYYLTQIESARYEQEWQSNTLEILDKDTLTINEFVRKLQNFFSYYISHAFFSEKDFEKVRKWLESYESIFDQLLQQEIITKDKKFPIVIQK